MIPLHPKDQEYFDDFPAAIMKILQEYHITNCNATIPFFGPMLYFLARAFRCEKILEIGFAQGYTSFYLANAIKDNAIRYQYLTPMYYGIDIKDNDILRENFDIFKFSYDLRIMDSIDIDSNTFKDTQFDMIFADGCHDEEHVVYEMQTLYTQLKNGGYWIMHDVRGPAEEGWHKIKKLILDGVYKFEHVILDDNVYGMAILHKNENEDINRRYWVGEK